MWHGPKWCLVADVCISQSVILVVEYYLFKLYRNTPNTSKHACGYPLPNFTSHLTPMLFIAI